MKKKIVAVLALMMILAMESTTVFATGSQSPTSTTVTTGETTPDGAFLSGSAGIPEDGNTLSGDAYYIDPSAGPRGMFLSGAVSPKTSGESPLVAAIAATVALAGVAVCSKKLAFKQCTERHGN